MIITGNLKFKHAIIVNAELLKNVFEFIKQYYEDVTIRAKLENDNSITLKDLDELLSYENFGANRIKKIIFEKDYGSAFSLAFETRPSVFFSYSSTVTVEYKIDNIDHSILIEEKLRNILLKNKQPCYYTFITKVSYMCFLIFMGAISALLNIYVFINNSPIMHQSFSIASINIGIIFFIFIFAISYILSKLRKYLYPPIIFYLGNEVLKYDKVKGFRVNFFWCVGIATILSVFLAKLL